MKTSHKKKNEYTFPLMKIRITLFYRKTSKSQPTSCWVLSPLRLTGVSPDEPEVICSTKWTYTACICPPITSYRKDLFM